MCSMAPPLWQGIAWNSWLFFSKPAITYGKLDKNDFFLLKQQNRENIQSVVRETWTYFTPSSVPSIVFTKRRVPPSWQLRPRPDEVLHQWDVFENKTSQRFTSSLCVFSSNSRGDVLWGNTGWGWGHLTIDNGSSASQHPLCSGGEMSPSLIRGAQIFPLLNQTQFFFSWNHSAAFFHQGIHNKNALFLYLSI